MLAIDIPSGLNADDGSASVCIRADLTVTMAGVKTGMLTGKGPAACGRVEVARIGIPDEYLEEAADGVSVFTAFDARALLRREPFDTFKNQRGHLAVIGGSRNYASAPFLAAETALRSGSGLVTVLLPETAEIHCVVRKALIVRRLETGGLPAFSAASVPELEEELENKSALAVGPGMMHRPESLVFLRRVIRSGAPLALDADALNLIAADPSLLEAHGGSVVLTPHPGEMARLTGKSIEDVLRDPAGFAENTAKAFGCIVLLKGAVSVAAHPDGRLRYNASGNPGLAKGGSGDVLTGIITALLAQGLEPFDAASAGAYILGSSAESALELLHERALTAGDVLDAIEKTAGITEHRN